MYNQANRGSHPLPPPPPQPPAYQQAPPPPPPPSHFQHFAPPPPPPPPHVYLHGPPSTSTFMPNVGQSYATPSQMHHGNGMAPPHSYSTLGQNSYSTLGQNSQHSLNIGVHSHPMPPPVHPPHAAHTHQEPSWAPGPPARVLPPPPPPPPSSSQGQILYNSPFHQPPSQPGDIQNLQRSHNTLPPPPPPPTCGPGGVNAHSTVGNYQMPSISAPPPPLPSCPPPVAPSPPPISPSVTSASSQAARTDDLNCLKVSGSESKDMDSVDRVVAPCPSGTVPLCNSDANQGGGSCREVAVAGRDELLSTRSVILNLPPAPTKPTDEKTVQKIEGFCQLIAENGADIEDKIRQDEFQNPEYAFLFGGDPGTEAAISHSYFLWVKKKYKLELRGHEENSESQLRPLAVSSFQEQHHLHAATVNADSDMEMEDDITLSDKDQGSNYAIEAFTKPHDQVNIVFSIDKQQQQNSTENDPTKDILSDGSRLLSDEHMKPAKSVTKVSSLVNETTEVVECPLGSVLERSSTPVSIDFIQNGTSDHDEATNPVRDSGKLIRSGSPIRLLQDYASDGTSDNEDEVCAADANVFTVSSGADTGVSAAHKDSNSYLETDIGSKSPCNTQTELEMLSKTTQNDSEISPHLVQESKGTCKGSVSSSNHGCIEHNLENQVSAHFTRSTEAFQVKDGLSGTGIDSDHKGGYAEQENERKNPKIKPTVMKVDKFGRHLKEGATDSDSDDSYNHQTRRLKKRDRSRSRSRSPIDRRSRRRRRSPRRRNDKRSRSRSRSRSPRRHGSRSRSPILRRSGDFRGENVRREKGQCFNFLRGKCYRGASCRYSHHEPEKNATSRRNRNKHDLEVYSHEKVSRKNEGMKDISSKMSDYEHDEVRSQGVDLCQNVNGQEAVQRKEDSGMHTVVSTNFGLDGQSVDSNPNKSEGLREVAPEVQETLVVREVPKTLIHENDGFQKEVSPHQQHLVDGFRADAFIPSGDTPANVIASEDGSFVQQVQSNASGGVPEQSADPSQVLNVSLRTDSSSDKGSIISASADKISGSEPLPYMLPSTQIQLATSSVDPCVTSEQPSVHAQVSKELPPHSGSSVEFPLPTYQLPASAVSHSQSENAVHMPQNSRQHGAVQQNSFFPFQSTIRGKFEPYPAPFHTPNSHFSVPPNSCWTSLPLPPPPPPPSSVYNSSLNSEVAKPFVSSEFNQSQLHLRTDFVSQTFMNPGLPTHSQSSKFQEQAYPSMQDHSQKFMHTEPFSPNHLPQGNPASQLLSGPSLGRESHHNLSMQDTHFSSSLPFGGLDPQPKQFSWESDVNRLRPCLDGRLLPEGHFNTSSHIHPLPQKPQSVYNFQYPASNVNLGVSGETVNASRYPQDVLDSNHSTSFPDFGGSRITAHYNPYASTFDQSLSSKFSSSILRQENDIINGNTCGSSRSNHTPIYGEGDGVGPKSASSPKSARAVGQPLPRSGGEQYDPLFDSIEPSSSLKKLDFDHKRDTTGESNIRLRSKSSHVSSDMEEKKHQEVGAVASTSSQNNDEYGETADAEVGAVENDSLSNHTDVENSGDDEINQIKSPGKKKKSKDSRSMKLFKVSIANFVKEVLKPSWRQGNMSKVAFKTIVKKTVDKVSGAMKGHRVPKSQAKISQYIDSSQRKLTKLVMGYVDKYVKV